MNDPDHAVEFFIAKDLTRSLGSGCGCYDNKTVTIDKSGKVAQYRCGLSVGVDKRKNI